VVQAWSVLVETAVGGLPGVGVQAEELTAADGEDGVVETTGRLVLVEDGFGAQQG
jgi:hypothetical protein